MGWIGLATAYLAGILSVFSPCVLPLLPIVVGSAAASHRFGPAALAGGLAVSFAALSLFLATLGFALGLSEDDFRTVAAVLLIGLGLVLALPAANARFALAAGPLAEWGERRFGGRAGAGIAGQFATGLLLGIVWTPCVGPTLAAFSVLIARGENLAGAGAAMLLLGLGAATPLVLVGLVSRATLARWRASLAGAGKGVRAALGVLMIAIGVLTLTGLDRSLQTLLVETSPDWLTELTTRF